MSDLVTVRPDTPQDVVIIDHQGLEKFIDRFIAGMDVAPKSRVSYRQNIGYFFQWTKENRVQTFNRDTILEYKRSLEKAVYSPFSIAAYLNAVRQFFTWAETMQIFPNISRGIKSPKKPNGYQKDPLSRDQLWMMLDKIDRSTLEGKRDYALLTILAYTGIRCIESVRANMENIRHVSGKSILFVHGKGRSAADEPIVLTPLTENPLREYLKARGSLDLQSPLFGSLSRRNLNQRLTTNSVSRIVKQRLKAVDLVSVRWTAHSLRHTALHLLLEAGGDLLAAKTLGRHANIATTMQYTGRVDRLKDPPEEKLAKYCERSNNR